jgi:hypothetical protein
VGDNGPGALTYAPQVQSSEGSTLLDLDDIAFHTQAHGKPSDVFEELLYLNASLAGA